MAGPSAHADSDEPDLQARLKIRIWREWLLSTAALLALTLCLSYFSNALGLRNLDNTVYDRLSALFVHNIASEDIVIVAIDDDSIQEMGHWPWRRARHADLLEKLAQARAVAFDLVFSEPNPAYPGDDAMLARAIREHGRVVLPLVISRDNQTLIPPIPILADATAYSGTINIYPDSDGVIRSFFTQKKLDNDQLLHHITLAMLEAGQDHEAARGLRDKDGTTPLRIAYSEFAHDTALLPYNRVLDGSITPSTFKDKYVLVGAWASGLGDTFATPYSSTQGVMPGVRVLANLLNGSLSNQWIHTPNRLILALLSIIPVLISCAAFLFLSPQRAFVFSIVVMAATFATASLVLQMFLWWLPPSAALIGTALAYPVWAWRSQHAALRHIDQELALLRSERLIPFVQESDAGKRAYGSLPLRDQTLLARIRQLHGTINGMRIAQRQRNETLRFLSHDMRAPLNSILALTDLQRNRIQSDQPDPQTLGQFDYYANRTLALVDGFVALSRAEAIELAFLPVNLSEVIIQCSEGAWAHAQRKQIHIDTSGLPDAAWISADASLMERVWTNLLDNALKYSPDNTTIRCTLQRDGNDWIAAVEDQGRGMDPSALTSAFTPFVRLDENRPDNPSGVGLGLAFVQTVIARHNGQIDIQSQPDKGTRITIRLRALDL